ARPNGLGSFERHVLEHMSDAGLAGGVVHRAGIDVGVKGNDRGFVALGDDEVKSVGERELSYFFFEFLKTLCRSRKRQKHGYHQDSLAVWHVGSSYLGDRCRPSQANNLVLPHGFIRKMLRAG